MRNSGSLRFRLTLWYAGVLAAILIIFSLAIYAGVSHFLKRNFQESIVKDAEEVGSIVRENANEVDESSIAREVGEHFSPESNERFVRVLGANGAAVYSAGPDQMFPPWARPSDPDQASDTIYRQPGNEEILVRTQPVQTDSGKRYFVQVAASLAPNNEILRDLLGVLALALLLATSAAVTGGFFLIRSSLKPLDNMAMQAQRITSRSLHERMPASETGDELQQLSTSLNRMIERLEEAFHHISRFSADASHELRTPLTIMRGELESVVQDPGIDPAAREAIGIALEETVRLSKIVDQLLIMSRLEAGEAFLEFGRFDLCDLVRTTVEHMRLLADEKKLSVNVEASGPVHVDGDQSRIQQVMVNLLDNAIKYTPESGSVSVSIRAEGDKAVLTIADTGIGISEEAQAHIFERFYRTDKARSRRLGGTGLGLSIVKSIGIAHGGRVSVQSTEGHGSTFRFEMPRAADTKAGSISEEKQNIASAKIVEKIGEAQ
jgi:heavy metal sensor kinase